MAVSDELPHDEELRSLYRRLPADEPRAEIDEAILSAARELGGAAARKPADAAAREHEGQRRRFLARARWMLPIAAAASVILTVTLTRLTPEQPAIAPSELRETSDDSNAYGTAGLEAAEEDKADIAQSAPESPVLSDGPIDGARGSGLAKSARQAPPAMAEPDAGKPQPAKEANEPAAAPAKPKSEAATGTARLHEDRRRAESIAAGRAATAESVEKRTAEERQPKDAPAPVPAPPEDSAISGAAPAPPPAAGMASRDEARIDEDQAAAQSDVLARKAPEAEQERPAPSHEWPFGLAPGLDQTEACRQIASALQATCRFHLGVAVVHLKEEAMVDRGEFAGRKVTRITLVARSGPLTSVGLQLEGFTTDQVLVAPPAP
jgi:hypothetical protein